MSVPSSASLLMISSMSLFAHLKEYRQMKAATEKIPIYSVFGDTVMRAITQTRPLSSSALQAIRGFSSDKCDRYGKDIIHMVKATHEQQPVTPLTGRPPLVVMRFRRTSHSLSDCRKKSVLSKKPFDIGKVAAPVTKRVPLTSPANEGIYILELSQGRVYVGQSSDMRRRVQQHLSGRGSAFTKEFPPTGVMLPRLGCVTGSAEAAERDETLRYMFLRGIQYVRGWKYTRVQISPEEIQDAEENIREIFNLCRRCGRSGHFITHCRSSLDRLGRPCKGYA